MKKLFILPLLALSLISCGQKYDNKDNVSKMYVNVAYTFNYQSGYCEVETSDKNYNIKFGEVFFAPHRKDWQTDNEFYIYLGGAKLLVIY